MLEVEYRQSRGLATSEGHAQTGRRRFCWNRSERSTAIARVLQEMFYLTRYNMMIPPVVHGLRSAGYYFLDLQPSWPGRCRRTRPILNVNDQHADQKLMWARGSCSRS